MFQGTGEHTVSRLFVSCMTQGIFVGHHDRTGAVLCSAKNGVVRGNRRTRQTGRCMRRDKLGRFVWHSVADSGSRIEVDEEGPS